MNKKQYHLAAARALGGLLESIRNDDWHGAREDLDRLQEIMQQDENNDKHADPQAITGALYLVRGYLASRRERMRKLTD